MSRQPTTSVVPRRIADEFDYAAPAEMFMARTRMVRKSPIGYRRFTTAAEAIRFVVEEIPAPFLVGAVLEVNEQRYDHRDIRDLYDRATYPLARHEPGG